MLPLAPSLPLHQVLHQGLGPSAAMRDARMRVRGVQGLRVMDGVALPQGVRGPTSAPINTAARKTAAP